MTTLSFAVPAQPLPESHRHNDGSNIAVWIALAVAFSSSRRGYCRFWRRKDKPAQL